jgi:hypothetical protein
MAALLAGCMPVKGYDSPEAQGVVTDAQTHHPIAGAQVLVAESPQINTMTDAGGTFVLHPEVRTLWVPPLPRDLSAPEGTLMVEAPGYQTRLIALHRGLNFLRVELEKTSP